MKNNYFSFLFLFFSLGAIGQIVTIPDVNFKTLLLASNVSNAIAKNSSGTNIKIDINNDNEIQVTEALNVAQLNVSTNSIATNNISSMDGIQYFTNLTYLDCSSNSITDLNLTALINLQFLQANNGTLSSLNVTGLNNLIKLYCYNNTMSALNLSGLTNLQWLWCENNSITSLDFNGLTALKYAFCSNNQLSSIINTANLGIIEFLSANNNLNSLDLTGLTLLRYLDFSANNISSVNLQSTLTSLETLYCSGNPLTTINVNGLMGLRLLSVSNTLVTNIDCSQSGTSQLIATDCPNLQTINVRNGVFSFSDPDLLFFAFRIHNNPLLVSICTDDGEQNQLALTNYNTSGNVLVYNGSNCDILVSVNMSVDDFNKAVVTIYPNPTSGIVNIEVSNNQVINKASITNVLGQTIMTFENASTIDISSLTKGTYFITVETLSGRKTQRIIKL
ncbi:leucine-rich repeat domain-containing protein [Flavobacterium paronense]|uniref:Leucine-rich repeat domain-containing protein n=1 Tax=Flavobacterium paronense TaxID=1392775 RepID=A0ABV5GBQ5_9FLAO|nr:leucine-rich repeat domain-containing protein [Flavobacterium paronense]MDN3677614.1 leucine-rich repeat domain-containing protein [Flavobacterium paronense]